MHYFAKIPTLEDVLLSSWVLSWLRACTTTGSREERERRGRTEEAWVSAANTSWWAACREPHLWEEACEEREDL